MTLKLEKETTSIMLFTADELNHNDYIQRWDPEDEEYIINSKIYNNQLELMYKIILIIEKLKNIKIFKTNRGNEWNIFGEMFIGNIKNYKSLYSFDFDNNIRYDEKENKYSIILYKKY